MLLNGAGTASAQDPYAKYATEFACRTAGFQYVLSGKAYRYDCTGPHSGSSTGQKWWLYLIWSHLSRWAVYCCGVDVAAAHIVTMRRGHVRFAACIEPVSVHEKVNPSWLGPGTHRHERARIRCAQWNDSGLATADCVRPLSVQVLS
ncbi:hypothetical protein [Amycolatopsis magusensis]|nr:hypothetical protein [Amycolatopsis magusensis]